MGAKVTVGSHGRPLTRDDGTAAVYGGAILGGGGGGSIEAGLEMVRAVFAAGTPRLIPVEALAPNDQVVTVGLVGSPAAPLAKVTPADYVRAVRLLEEDVARHEGSPLNDFIKGFIANENGAVASVNGWLQAAVLSRPVVDCPCDGRAHPTALMGALGLHREPSYLSRQSAVGGDPAGGLYLEMTVRGELTRASTAVRTASIQAGGLVAVARNPVPAARAASHGAPGGISQAIAVGRALLDRGFEGVASLFAAPEAFDGRIRAVELRTAGGFDAGFLTIELAKPPVGGPTLRIDFWNEYVSLEEQTERGGRRLFTFPDLIAIFELPTLRPLTSADVRSGQEVRLLCVRRGELKIGAAVLDPELLRAVETAVGREIAG